ncbi:MAG TPA: glycoside hydrolase family 16 protein [Microlunatus sp.]|nr:glycoside hydrolase family 16 protein [Microlunatus sp.]
MTSDRRRRWPLLVVLAVLATVIATVAVRQATDPSATPSTSSNRVVLDENFDGGTLDESRWNTCHWWNDGGCTIASNNELEWYRPEQVTVADGTLRLTAAPNRYVASDGETYDFTSGMVTTGPTPDDDNAKVAITYGTVEARFKAPAGRGLWPAIWLLPASKESRPEIDLLEMIGQDPSELILHFHPEDRDADSPSKRVRVTAPDLAEDWHTVGLSWTPGKLVYTLDGTPIWTVTGDQVPSEPMYLVMNLAVGGAYPGPPDSRTPFPATFEIDYVRMSTGA